MPAHKSRAPLWFGLGALALFGSCGTCAAIGAMLPDPPKSSASASDVDDSLGDAVASDDGPLLRDDVPRPAAEVIQKARRAITRRDHRALQKLLVTDDGSFEIEDELEATSGRAAVRGWKKNPEMLRRIDRALSETCDVDAYEDGHVLILCGRDREGGTFVMLSNMVDDDERRSRYRITSVGTVE